METAVFWLVIVGPILIGLAGAIWYGSGKTPALWTGFAGVMLLLLAGALQLQQAIWSSEASAPAPAPTNPTQGTGGKGGDAKVGRDGIAIGGSGGQVGKYGIGGSGGNAEVHGDGLAAGGTGGAAGDDGIWRPPAKSGYEIAQRKLGRPVDPSLRQFGRGGAMPGYEPKLAIIEQLRAAYFEKTQSLHNPFLKI